MEKVVLVLLGFVTMTLADFTQENVGLDNPYLVDGDILLTPQQRTAWYGGRAAVRNKQWPGAVVVFSFHQSVSKALGDSIREAFKEYEQKTCLQFRQRTTENDYVEFISYEQGCFSNVGKVGGRQRLSLGPGCGAYGTILHEIGHTLGYHHEHNRPDRDDYITILWDNIIPKYKFAFYKKPASYVDTLGTPYDYNSVMHYAAYGFSVNSKPTIQVKQSAYIGARKLSVIDVYEINRYYKCPGVTEMPFPTNGPPTSQFICTFDKDSCGFIQLPRPDDYFDWYRLSGKTPSAETGPDGDHTTGTGSYMYIEVSNLKKGDLAIMTKKVVLTGRSCLTFYYNMNGAYMGSIKVVVQGQTVFEKTGDQGKGWKKADVQLQGTGETKLEFHGAAGGNFRGDAAIDDLSMRDCQTVTSPATPPVTVLSTTAPPIGTPAPGFKCNFDQDLCGFTQETDDDFEWTRSNVKTPTWDSGPDVDHTTGTGFYLYTEASGLKQGDKAILSKTIQLSANTCLSFFYHMHGNEMGSILVYLDDRQISKKTGPQGKGWKEAVVKLDGTGSAKLFIHGIIGSGFRSDAGIDDLSVGQCTQ